MNRYIYNIQHRKQLVSLVSNKTIRDNFLRFIFAILQFVGIFDYAPKKYSEIIYKMIKIDQYDQYDPEFVSSLCSRRKTSNFLIAKVGIKSMHLKIYQKDRIIVSIFFFHIDFLHAIIFFFLNYGLSFNQYIIRYITIHKCEYFLIGRKWNGKEVNEEN